MFDSLGEFIDALDHRGELVRVTAPVSADLEIAQITDRVSKATAPHPPSPAARRNDPAFFDRGGPALLFENVEHADFPVLINAFGSYRRMELALGCQENPHSDEVVHAAGGFDALAALIAELVKPEPPRSPREALAMARRFAPLLRVGPKRKRRPGPCQELVYDGDAVDLTRLPLIKCWPLDGDLGAIGYPADINDRVPEIDPHNPSIRGRYVTFAGIHTINAADAGSPRPASHNIGMYRLQLLGQRRLAMHWHMHHDGAAHWRSWKRLGKPMPVAIAFGGEAVLPYAATCPLPPGVSELLMAGFLNMGGIPLCRARTVPLWVPANAEIVIEGFVSTDAGPPGLDGRTADARHLGPGAVLEGPFGDHTGFYSLPDRYPIVEVTAITHRRDAVFPATIVGLPPQEDYYLGKATERIMLPLLRTIIPDIEDYDLPMFGAFHNAAFIAVEKAYPLQARRVMHAVWGAGQMAWTKSVFVVDADVDVHDPSAVLRAVALHCRPDRDIELVRGPVDILDHSAPRFGAGTKVGFDATRKIPGEEIGAIAIDAEQPDPILTGDERDRLLALVGDLDRVEIAVLPDDLARGWLFVRIAKDAPGQGLAVLEALAGPCDLVVPPFVVVLAGVDVADLHQAMFHFLANTDLRRDALTVGAAAEGDRPWIGYDATPKEAGDERLGEPVRDWPPVLEMSQEIRASVEQRWGEYGIPLD